MSVITQFRIKALLNEAFQRADVPNTAIQWFGKCEICSLDPNIFTEKNFVATESSDSGESPSSTGLLKLSIVMPSTSAGPSQRPTANPS